MSSVAVIRIVVCSVLLLAFAAPSAEAVWHDDALCAAAQRLSRGEIGTAILGLEAVRQIVRQIVRETVRDGIAETPGRRSSAEH